MIRRNPDAVAILVILLFLPVQYTTGRLLSPFRIGLDPIHRELTIERDRLRQEKQRMRDDLRREIEQFRSERERMRNEVREGLRDAFRFRSL